jgi:hypothetical protein
MLIQPRHAYKLRALSILAGIVYHYDPILLSLLLQSKNVRYFYILNKIISYTSDGDIISTYRHYVTCMICIKDDSR